MTMVPVPGSQNVIGLSLLPNTSRAIVGYHSIYSMSHRLPVRIRSSRHYERPNSRVRVVTDWEIVRRPAKSCPRTASRCTDHAVRLFMLGWKYLMTPDWSAGAMYGRAGITISCAWSPRIVFKLNSRIINGLEDVSFLRALSSRTANSVP